jgi:putative protease
MISRPELLAPVQDWITLKNLDDLADAVYFGVQNFNMRAKANNFERKDLKDVVEHCHSRKNLTNVYLTTNILVYDSELEDLESLILEAKDSGIDAIIVHDLAAIKIAKRNNMKFHISTQANISNSESAEFYENLGAERLILARELSLKQIKSIKANISKCEIECFIHGSMCTSISGRCYFSATICDSEEYSANKGNCVQPCRREWTVIDDERNEFIYNGQMFLNAKDLCMIEYIPELIEAKIDAFKIEGRMKDPLYVKTVTECYKEAMECYYDNTYSKEKINQWLEKLSKVYNRGFHTGFYFRRPTIENIELTKRGNVSLYNKRYIGKVLSYDEPSKSANILIEARGITVKVGDQLIIIGKELNHYEEIKTIVFKGKKLKTIERNHNQTTVRINTRLRNKVEENDKIYIFTKT